MGGEHGGDQQNTGRERTGTTVGGVHQSSHAAVLLNLKFEFSKLRIPKPFSSSICCLCLLTWHTEVMLTLIMVVMNCERKLTGEYFLTTMATKN